MSTKLNEGPKKLWLEALRSGEYQQGHYALATPEDDGTVGYCCLGVACELAYQAGVVAFKEENSFGNIDYDSRSGFLPNSVQRWLGVNYSHVETDSGKNLVTLNDQHGFTFEQIADIIETEL